MPFCYQYWPQNKHALHGIKSINVLSKHFSSCLNENYLTHMTREYQLLKARIQYLKVKGSKSKLMFAEHPETS